MSGNSLGKGRGLGACLVVLFVSGCQILPDSGVEMEPDNRMRCGDRELTYHQTESGLKLEVDGKAYFLEQVESTSGSQYVASEGSETEFWIKGERALVTLEGSELPECAYTSGPYLAGPVWMVTEVGGESVMTNYRASMHFRADGRLGGRASCNHFTARWERLGSNVVIETAAATRMACPTAVMDQEQRFLGALSRVAGFSVNEQRVLTLENAEGEAVIRAEPRSGRGNSE
ncbi:heat shock protein HslJ [Halospina denitrificans]|uniref:Heat shock protein HslJ n=1 Tax=Halospina denitrificans TaxID=332522 RepID=A0A4V3EPW4_9GAMM|nr:META domain-containing protein [Halospina denitrificans]TDT37688.1 heat shock protein HslJ [Halospina denitrificans]